MRARASRVSLVSLLFTSSRDFMCFRVKPALTVMKFHGRSPMRTLKNTWVHETPMWARAIFIICPGDPGNSLKNVR